MFYDYQLDAINNLRNGSILCGGVGSGKSLTALGYYYKMQGGDLNDIKKHIKMQPLYIITTARKRDTLEWEKELTRFNIDVKKDKYEIYIDSWNNIEKYKNVSNSFFIFDEQRVVGYGKWAKTFIHISKYNNWILLSATPGDTWTDYVPVFIANGFYRNKTHFYNEHVVYKSNFNKYPKIEKFVNIERLNRLRNRILVDMDYKKKTTPHHADIFVEYDKMAYKDLMHNRWNHEKEQPIENASELCYELRKIVNSDISRVTKIMELADKIDKMIIFYNFDYELEILKNIYFGEDVKIAEWNGHKHQPIPESKRWIYLVQYTAGAEGWNCIKTDTIVFYSQNYSYKILAQSCGRIDRLNTPFMDLYYYHLKSKSPIDVAISRAIKQKKKFNESRFAQK